MGGRSAFSASKIPIKIFCYTSEPDKTLFKPLWISLPCKYLFNNVGPVTEITNNNNVGIEKNPKNDIESATGRKNRLRQPKR
ncbi:hypothetical protein AX660_10785 [Paraglaciecola hydrolytica]|uniref:Uncharacterized protein n=1 Tax=Paraglaciecola hydrolytica TaxID=1799789 RepID=A0A136A5B8_9ALTE|nr:hypothetical protein AX660_10785 [Paraglaciecola hydrolytica]